LIVPRASLALVLRAVMIGALGWASAGCAGEGDALHGAVHGTVRSTPGGKGLKGVDVTFVSDTLEEADDTTDAEGRFVIHVAARTPSGRLTASKVGYETSTVSVFLDDGEVKIDIELERD
jgi:hypothetical protein